MTPIEQLQETAPVRIYPGTLGGALIAEERGLGAIRFVGGRPQWVAGAEVRFEREAGR